MDWSRDLRAVEHLWWIIHQILEKFMWKNSTCQRNNGWWKKILQRGKLFFLTDIDISAELKMIYLTDLNEYQYNMYNLLNSITDLFQIYLN